MNKKEHAKPPGDLFYNSVRASFERSGQQKIRIGGEILVTTPVFSAYWYFANERQKMFFERLRSPDARRLTDDPILSDFRFTNAYRASDRVSQYLIRNVIYQNELSNTDEELFFRIILFKLFNKIETWKVLEQKLGAVSIENFDRKILDVALRQQLSHGHSIYSAAYIMPSARSTFGCKYKHQNHLQLIEYMLQHEFPQKLRQARSMEEVYNTFLSAPSIGPFLAYQFATDVNYSTITDFGESDFVVAGPGAVDGISKCFIGLNGVSFEDVIRYMYNNQEQHFAQMSINFRSLWGRPLQLIDCQNIFCEISKYARVAFPEMAGAWSRVRIKQKYRARKNPPVPWYPPKWGINAKIEKDAYG